MLIASRFHRPNAPVQLANPDGTFTTYFFLPIAPTVPNSEHVAEVAPPHHIERLLAIPEGYYIAEANAALAAVSANAGGPVKPVPTTPAAEVVNQLAASAAAAVAFLAAPVATDTSSEPPVAAVVAEPVAPATAETPAPPPVGDHVDPQPPADNPERKVLEDAAHELLARTPAAFKAAVQTVAPDVLKLALEIETGKGSDERATYTKALRAALSK